MKAINMLNILSYVGMDLQSEVCLWTLLGLLRTIFDATLFKVNANLKQVWQMRMPEELTRPVQRVLRTMISGVILVQCFTLHVYLASYIVLLYPVFLEERPTLVLPWLLLAAIRKLLCELTSLALGLGTCVLLGPARPPCIKFVIVKLASITPAFYMWFLVFSYYHALKMTTAFKTLTAVLPPNDHDYGLELAVRRRMTKSLQGEDQLRRKLIASLYGERNASMRMFNAISTPNINTKIQSPTNSIDDMMCLEVLRPQSVTSNRTISDIGTYEDWFGNEVSLPRDTDRILEQFGLMLLRIAAFLKKEEMDQLKYLNTSSQTMLTKPDIILKCTAEPNDDTDTPPHVGSSKGRVASYLTEYPQIFMKKTSEVYRPQTSEHELIQVKNTCVKIQQTDEQNNVESENYLSYEITRRTKTVELDLRDNQSIDQSMQPVFIRESKNFTVKKHKNCTDNNINKKNVKCKTVNTDCQFKSSNKSMCTEKIHQLAVTEKNIREKIQRRIVDNNNIRKSKIKKEKGKVSSSPSEISTSSNST